MYLNVATDDLYHKIAQSNYCLACVVRINMVVLENDTATRCTLHLFQCNIVLYEKDVGIYLVLWLFFHLAHIYHRLIVSLSHYCDIIHTCIWAKISIPCMQACVSMATIIMFVHTALQLFTIWDRPIDYIKFLFIIGVSQNKHTTLITLRENHCACVCMYVCMQVCACSDTSSTCSSCAYTCWNCNLV